MRDLDDENEYDYDEAPRRSSRGTVESLLLLGALTLIAMPAIKGIARRWHVRNPAAAGEDKIDDSLNDTYPASDPPAARYVDIPVNRR